MTDHKITEARPDTTVGAGSPVSKQVSWWPVHQFITEMVAKANVGPLPAAGTPAWDALADGDPRKLLALAAAGEHWALRIETAQTALAEASQAISAAADWTAIARSNLRHADAVRGGAYIPRTRRAS